MHHLCFIYPPPPHKLWFSILLLTGLFFSLGLEAQVPASSTNSGDFFEFLSIDDLSDAEKTALGLPIEASGTSYDYIRFNNQQSNAENGYYTLQLPLGSELSPSWLKITYANQGTNHISMRGEGQFGDFAVFFVENEGASGYGYTNTKMFSIAPIDESFSEVTYEDLPATDQVPLPDVVAENIPGEANEQSTIECAATIDVLFLRTFDADALFTSSSRFPQTFERMVIAVTDHTNETLQNSQVGPKQIRAIIHDVPVPQIQYTPGPPGDEGPCYGAMAVLKTDQSIKILRQFYNADIVVYYDDQLAPCGGIAGGFSARYDDAYVLNNIIEELGDFSLLHINTHELGHIFGGFHRGHHQLIQGPSLKHTMMATGLNKGALIEHYSNPDVEYTHPANGVSEVTGSQISNTSGAVIRNFCRQAQMETSGDFLARISVQQLAPKQPCDEIRLFGRADAGNTGGPNSGPYTYEWRVSTSGRYSSATPFSTQQNPVWILPDPNQTYFIFLNVTTASGVTTRVMRAVSNPCSVGPPDLQFFRVSSDKGETPHRYSHDIAVNYSSSSTLRTMTFESSAEYNEDVIAKLYNSSGQIVSNSLPSNLGGKSYLPVTSTMPSGIYYLVLERLDGSILKSTRFPLVK